MFSRIAIGTANWGNDYNDSHVEESEWRDILDYCKCSGIDMLDTAVAYGTHTIDDSAFDKIIKIQDPKDYISYCYCCMAHDVDTWNEIKTKPNTGISLYKPIDFGGFIPSVVQVPYSLYDRRFEQYFPEWKSLGIEIHVRSIFLRGKILERATPQDCISFCLMNRYVDRVIIGADSLKQLRDNLRFLHRYNSLKKDDENLLIPMNWEKD